MTKFDEKIEKAVKADRKLSKKDYTIKSQPTEENKEEKLQDVTNMTSKKKENYTNYTLKKRGDYKDWIENWKKSNNPILEELEALRLQVWINEKGDIVLRDVDTQKENIILKSNISMKISSILGRQVYFYSWRGDDNNKVKPTELLSITASEYNPLIKSRFFFLEVNNKKKWYLNTFTPTEYMNHTDKPLKEPSTILKLIKHLVNYKEDRYHYFLNWLAYYWDTFKKPQTAIVLKGVQGAGKGIFADNVITPLFGKNQVSTITNEILESRFKANKFVNKSFYIFEETSKGNVKSNKDIKEFIKQIITNEHVPMEEKKITAFDVKITAPSIFFTNEVKFLEIEPSDRRFSVFLTGDKIINTDFLGFGSYEALAKQIKKELPDFARYLYNFEVDINLANVPMDTPEKRAVTQITNNSFQKFVIALRNKDLEFFDTLLDSEEVEDKVLFSEIETAFKEKRIKRAFITKLFNSTFQKNISSKKLLEELRGINPDLFSSENTITINGKKYLKLF